MVQEYAQALAWYQKAAEAGNAEAMYRLVVAYRDGEGVAKDPAQARRWFQKAAEAGNGVAKYHLSQQASK
jgi:TPR repeat protein